MHTFEIHTVLIWYTQFSGQVLQPSPRYNKLSYLSENLKTMSIFALISFIHKMV